MGDKLEVPYSAALRLLKIGYLLKETEQMTVCFEKSKKDIIEQLYLIKQLALFVLRDEVILEISRGLYSMENSQYNNVLCKKFLYDLKNLIFEGDEFIC